MSPADRVRLCRLLRRHGYLGVATELRRIAEETADPATRCPAMSGGERRTLRRVLESPTSKPAELPPDLVELWLAIGPRARAVLVAVARRLAHGAQQYQDDLSPGRDWRAEAAAEALDCAVYLARALLTEGTTTLTAARVASQTED